MKSYAKPWQVLVIPSQIVEIALAADDDQVCALLSKVVSDAEFWTGNLLVVTEEATNLHESERVEALLRQLELVSGQTGKRHHIEAASGGAGLCVVEFFATLEIEPPGVIGLSGGWFLDDHSPNSLQTISDNLEALEICPVAILTDAIVAPDPYQFIRYHVTGEWEAIEREGFKRTNEGGIGVGGSSTSGDTFTFAERYQAERLQQILTTMETIRTAASPLETAAALQGVSVQAIIDSARAYGRREMSDLETALVGVDLPYIPVRSFLDDRDAREFRILEVDVTHGVRVGGEKDGEERWEPRSVTVVKSALIEEYRTIPATVPVRRQLRNRM